MTGQLRFTRKIFADDPNIEDYIDKSYSDLYAPVDVTFTSYTTTFLDSPWISSDQFVLLDEIAIDKIDLEFDDSKL